MSNKFKQIIVMGVSGSGKSVVGETLSKKINFEFFDADSFHSKENVEKMSKGIPLEDSDRIPWLNTMASFLNSRNEKNKSSILACSALKKNYRDILRVSSNILFVYLKGEESLIIDRHTTREGHFMPTSLVTSQLNTLEEPKNALYISIDKSVEEIVSTIIESFNL